MDLDEALESARAGDRDGLATLYRALSAPMLSYLRTQTRSRQDAEDLLGEVFLAAVKDLGSFDGNASAFKGWLYRIGTNRAIDLARRRKRRPEEPLEITEDEPAEDDTERAALAQVDRDRLWRAVRGLPEAQRVVIALRLAAGLTTAEIASAVGKRANAVKALQHRALQRLARELEAYPRAGAERLGD